MASAVSLRPNHYEVLGLTPAASIDEITKAFARELSRPGPRSFATLADVSVAYEILRHPGRRGAYDSSLGLSAEPVRPPIEPSARASIPSSAPATLIERLTVDPAPPPRPSQEPNPRAESDAEPVMPFMAASPREPEPVPAPEQPRRRPEAVERIWFEPQFGGDRMLRRAERVHDAENGRFEWNRTVVAAGALLLSAAILGAWVGLEAGNDNQVEQADRTVTTRLPPAAALPIATPSPPAPSPSIAKARPERPIRSVPATDRIAQARAPLEIAVPEAQQSEAAQSGQTPGEDVATQPMVAELPAVEATAAKLPLPDAVVARTIGRIGYACGQVESTTVVEGAAPGVFKVTCTSGHSYRAAPVRGRYRFRRLGSR